MSEETTTAKQLTEVEALQINLEYATRLLWLVVHDLGGEVTITKKQIEEATFDEVRVSDTVGGGLHVQAVSSETEAGIADE